MERFRCMWIKFVCTLGTKHAAHFENFFTSGVDEEEPGFGALPQLFIIS